MSRIASMLTEKEQNLPKINIYKHIYKLLERKDKLAIIASFVCMLVSSVCDLLNPFYFAQILNTISKRTATGESIQLTADIVPWYILGIMAGLAIVAILSNGLAVLISSKLSIRLSARIRMKTFANTQYLAAIDVDKIGGNSIITRITSDATQVEQCFVAMNTFAIKAICLIIGGFILSIYQLTTIKGADASIWLILISFASIAIFFAIAGFIIKKAMPYFNGTRTALDTNNTIMSENIIGNKLIRIFNLEKNQAKRYEVGNKNLKQLSVKAENYMAFLMPASFLFVNFAYVIVYSFAGMYAWNSNPAQAADTAQLIGIIMSFVQYLMMIMLGLILITQFGYLFSRGKVCSNRIFYVMNKESAIRYDDCHNMIESGDIQFKNVSFAYHESKDGTNKDVIKNINLTIPQGTSLGVIGQTGSGKTTFINLITRLYDVTQGEVLVSNHNVKTINLQSLRDNIAVSLQDKVLIQGTIKSNILIGKQNATDQEVEQAAKNAEAWEFIKNKQDKLDAHVEQRGTNLSGGQKQRVSIARALIKKSKILIFDDSTSALDTITERKILDNLDHNFKNVTKIIVSQKIKSIQECDQIIVLDGGQITQHGKHEELLKDVNGIYRKIHDSQNTSLEG